MLLLLLSTENYLTHDDRNDQVLLAFSKCCGNYFEWSTKLISLQA